MSQACAIPDCGKPVASRDWCSSHYQRWKKHGNPLAGRTPEGTAVKFLREVVLPYAGSECLSWPFGTNGAGYGRAKIDGKDVLVTRYICATVHGPAPAGYQAAHSCGNGHKGCCNPHHLSWKTRAGNMADTLIHGTRLAGEKHNMARLSVADVVAIRSMPGTQASVAKHFGISQCHVSDIRRGRRWAS